MTMWHISDNVSLMSHDDSSHMHHQATPKWAGNRDARLNALNTKLSL